jgi:hypothetical protein
MWCSSLHTCMADQQLSKHLFYHLQRTLSQIKDIHAFLSAIQKCTDSACGCHQYHCPICPRDIYKPAVQSKLKRHLYAHWKIRIDYKGKMADDLLSRVSHSKCNNCVFWYHIVNIDWRQYNARIDAL